MTIDGKPVRLLLRGDYAAAARWIPYFAGLCRAFRLRNQTRYARTDAMRGKAQVIGGRLYVIDITAGADVLFYTLARGTGAGATNELVVMAWAEQPVSALQLERRFDDPAIGEDQYGSARISAYRHQYNKGYTSVVSAMARCGRKLVAVITAKWAYGYETPLLFIRYQSVTATGGVKNPTKTIPFGTDTQAMSLCLFGDRLLLVRPPASLGEAGWPPVNPSSYHIGDTGCVRAIVWTYKGAQVSSQTLQLADPWPYPQPDPPATTRNTWWLQSARVCRSAATTVKGEPAQDTYWLVHRISFNGPAEMPGDPPVPVPTIYRYRNQYRIQRRNLQSLGTVAAESDELPYTEVNPEPPPSHPYYYGSEVTFFEVILGSLVLIVCNLFSNVPYGLPGRDGGKQMYGGDRRIHRYDGYRFDPDTLALQDKLEDCGFARIGVRGQNTARRAYLHGFDEARFEWFPSDPGMPNFRTRLTGALWKAELSSAAPPAIGKGDKICDAGFGILADLGNLGWTEEHIGFVPEYDD